MASTPEALVLGRVCSKIGSGATPKGGKEAYLPSGPFALIRSQNVLNSGFSNNGLAYINEEQAKALDGVAVELGDVLLNITGDSVARVCQAPKSVLPARVNQHVAIIRPRPDILDPSFLRYFLVSPEQQTLLMTLASSGATRNALTKGMIEQIEVPAVPIGEQKQIARTLGSLDDRIDHNRALAAKLEAIARRLFKSWFVDFDPVRAKAAGEKPPGLADDIAALFPDRFVDSELGEIPEGWGIASFSAFAELDTTSVKPFDHPEMQWAHFSIPSFDEGRFPATETGEQIASNKYQVRPGSVLVSKLNPTQWRCWRPPSELVSKHSICSTEFMQFVAPENQQEFLWGMCESDPFREAVLATVDGTTGSRQRAKPKDVMRSTIVLPHSRLTAEYSSIVRPLLRRVDACILEARSLSQLRDLLLPRLISGKLRVSEAEEAIAEAMV